MDAKKNPLCKKNPLWMPKGSVRGVLALCLIGTVCYISVVSNDVPEGLLTLASAFAGYYAAKRSEETNQE